MNTQWILLLIALVGANLPWFSDKLFYVVPIQAKPKNIAWCLLELIVMYFVIGLIAFLTEKSSMGQVTEQHWEFYAVTACLFLVFAFPGFIYRFLWHKQK